MDSWKMCGDGIDDGLNDVWLISTQGSRKYCGYGHVMPFGNSDFAAY